jgi:hypothetical protein
VINGEGLGLGVEEDSNSPVSSEVSRESSGLLVGLIRFVGLGVGKGIGLVEGSKIPVNVAKLFTQHMNLNIL